MDKAEARIILEQQIEIYRRKSFSELSELGGNRCYEVIGASGATFQVEIEVMTDIKTKENILVIGGIDDGNLLKLSTYNVMSDSFVITPLGEILKQRDNKAPLDDPRPAGIFRRLRRFWSRD